MRKIYCQGSKREQRIAILENEALVDVVMEREGEEDIVGNIYMGRVENILKGMNAAFVNIGLEKNAYLHSDDMLKNEPLIQGQYVIVQVKKGDANQKGARVTCQIEFTGNYLVYMPYDATVAPSKKIKRNKGKWVELGKSWCSSSEGILFRSACDGANEEDVQREFLAFKEAFLSFSHKKKPALLYQKHSLIEKVLQIYPRETISYVEADCLETVQEWKKYLPKEAVTFYRGKENIFSHYLLDVEIKKGLSAHVPLPQGAFLLFEQGETMTVIDVNSGKFIGKNNVEETAFIINGLAVKEIARQLRLRNIGGMILIDFINMKEEKNKKELLVAMNEVLKADKLYTRIYGFTRLGLLEMTRKRVRKSLQESMQETCSVCHGTGFVSSAKEVAYALERVLLEKAEDENIIVELSKDVKQYIDCDKKNDVTFRIVESSFPMYMIRAI